MASMYSDINRLVSKGRREAVESSIRTASRAFDVALCKELRRKGTTKSIRLALYRLEDAFCKELGLDEDGEIPRYTRRGKG